MIERTCERCGILFLTQPCEVAKGAGRFCSRDCHNASQREPLDVKFWRRVNKTSSCWLWTGSVFKESGYGQMTIRTGKVVKPRGAHRVSWELNIGPIPDGLWVLHNCPGGDNKLCVNPAHLFLGTHADNMRDASQKGQMPSGERSGLVLHPESVIRGEDVTNSKLTEDIVRAIRANSDRTRGYPMRLARKYGVHHSLIRRIISGDAWGHVK